MTTSPHGRTIGRRPAPPLPRPRRGLWRRALRRACIALRLYPHVTSQRMPFKTVEFDAVLRKVAIAPTDRILDLGCGIGHQTLVLGSRCREIVGVDIDETVIARARDQAVAFAGEVNASFYGGRVQDLPLAPASFDKVFSFCVIEHIPDCDSVLRTLRSLLAPGGQLLLSADSLATLTDPVVIEEHRRQHFVHQYFTADTLRECLTRAGFVVDEIHSIFRSRFAGREFVRALHRGFRYGFVRALITSWRLRLHDAFHARTAPGIFLVARCHRPTI
ncbi:MAG: class I SAM-dependent methyltransferase [Planctomycetota bacterium]